MINEQTPSTVDIGFDETDEGLSVTIDTENLRLSSITPEDKQRYFTLIYGNKEVMEKFGVGTPIAEDVVQKMVERDSERWRKKIPFSRFAIERNDLDNTFQGDIYLGDRNYEPTPPGTAELVYAYAKSSWGKGVGTEAAKAVVNHYAPELVRRKYQTNGAPFSTITSCARLDNPGSIKILEEKVEMEYVKTEEKLGAMRKHYRKTIKP